jgi:2'-5' RNA ligase
LTLPDNRTAKHRLFIAIQPPPAVLDHLAAFTAGLGFVQAGVRVTARHLWHVTVAFLGDVPEPLLPAAARALDRAAAAVREPPVPARRGRTRAAPAAAPPVVRLSGGGRFGRGRFTIVWAGVDGDLRPLRRATVGALRRVRLPYDDQRYHPHLTLGRPGDRVPAAVVAADLAALAGYRGLSWTVGGLVLYRSHLGPKPVYEPLHSARLSGVPVTPDAGPG